LFRQTDKAHLFTSSPRAFMFELLLAVIVLLGLSAAGVLVLSFFSFTTSSRPIKVYK
jgi:hypothetical protein